MKTQSFLAIPALAGILASCALAQTSAPGQWRPAPGPLKTRWADQVNPQNPLPEYPRPQMARPNWQSLNGLWAYSLADATSTRPPAAMNGQILVPYPYESALSGIGKPSPSTQRIWCRRTFAVLPAWKGQRVLLHFGAANYDTLVSLNGQNVGSHRGGFDAFEFDITPNLKAGQNELVVGVANPLQTDVEDAQVEGKQRLKPGGIFYSGASGIWQSVWLEPVPAAHIESLKITPDIDASVLRVRVNSSGRFAGNASVQVSVLDGGQVVASATSTADSELRIPLRNAKLWSPESPFLYGLKVSLGVGAGTDSVTSYAAMRKISLVKDARGRTVLGLNNKPYFQVGVLDQGYWPDGIYTAPTDAALRYDIETAKSLGWNLLRKHAKVEPARWYAYADKIGMLVWQDMPQMYGVSSRENGGLTDAAKSQFDLEWSRIIAQNYNSPAIVVWTTFNEGMGQHDTERVVANTRALDPTRLVNNASGWVDKKAGDMHDSHVYPGPGSNAPEPNRAAVNGEFGGITYDAGHRWVNNVDVMGYGATLKSSWPATKRYQNLLKAAYDLKESRGTSAVVYTQLTDVEQEINGMLTYDRAVLKMDSKIVAAANRGQFLPLPPNPSPDLVATSEEEPLVWRYTFDQPNTNWFAPAFNDANWLSGPAPFGHDAGGVRTNWSTPNIWIRRRFTLPQSIPAKLNLLVKHDEEAQIFLNGELAASLTGYNDAYVPVPMSDQARAALRPGQNTIAVHVHQTIGGQSIDVGITPAR